MTVLGCFFCLAWVLTLLTALIIAPISIPYVAMYVWEWDESANFETDPLSHFIVTYFLVFLVMDIICCVMHYRDQMGFFDGWFHHSCYLGFFGWCLMKGFTIGILTTMPLEFPTVIIATGRVFPKLRQDLMFGFLFFLTRVVYHSFLLWRWYWMESPPTRMWPYPAFILCLHLYWFSLWSSGQIKRFRGETGSRIEKKSA
mmetsp:Transcript_35451/g.79998  ORF Transcript_35451/g.79998 Transcript_35451/m.79998 type:complete len:200 (+) Transcript_35451:335-934(+)